MSIRFNHDAMIEVIKKHFRVDHRSAATEAHNLHRSLAIANVLEASRNKARPPKDDIEGLKKAAKNIALAHRQISALGWFGENELPSLRVLMNLPDFHTPFQMRGESWTDGDELLMLLETLEEKLKSAANAIDPNSGPPLSTLFTDRTGLEFKGAGGPKKIAKKFLARFLAQTYWRLSGKKPTLSFNAVKGQKHGDFLDFVTDSFSVLGVSGNEVELAEQSRDALVPGEDGESEPGRNVWPQENSEKK